MKGRKGILGRGTTLGKCGGESSPERVRQEWSGVASVTLFIVWTFSRLSVPCGEGLAWFMESYRSIRLHKAWIAWVLSE